VRDGGAEQEGDAPRAAELVAVRRARDGSAERVVDCGAERAVDRPRAVAPVASAR